MPHPRTSFDGFALSSAVCGGRTRTPARSCRQPVYPTSERRSVTCVMLRRFNFLRRVNLDTRERVPAPTTRGRLGGKKEGGGPPHPPPPPGERERYVPTPPAPPPPPPRRRRPTRA